MKKSYLFILIIALIICAAYFSKERIVLKIIRLNAKKALPISKLEIKNLKFNPLKGLELHGVSIKSGLQRYSIYLEDLRIGYTLVSLLKGQINKVELSGMNISIAEGIKVNPGKPILKIKEIKASGSIKFQDYNIKNFNAALFSTSVQNKFKGNFQAENIIAQKIELSNLDMALEFSGDALSIPEFKVSAFEGEIKGSCMANLSSAGVKFSADITGKGIDLAKLDEDFNLKEKFEVTGLCDFYLKAKGNQKGLTELSGDLTAHEGGGKFIITDKDTLNRLNVSQEINLDAALEGIKNYRYDTGLARIYIEDGNIVVRMFMDGALGKRDLTVVLHDGLKLK